MEKTNKIRKLTILAMLTAISTALYFLAEIPIIPIAPHLKIDFSDIPALVAAIVTGPVGGITVEFLKNAIHLMRTGTFGLGELANFVVGVAVVLPVGLIYNKLKHKSKTKAMLIASAVAVVSIVVFGIGINALIYPLFMELIGNQIESNAVLITYLISTVTMNLVKACVTIIPVIPLLKVLEKQNIAKGLTQI